MADAFETTRYYKLMGVNQKKSLYEFPATECLELYNLDFDVQDSWQKRPGSTFAAYSGNQCSGPIYSVYEFIKLEGQSYVIAGSDTALFLLNGGGFTPLATGWCNGQPPDMLTFLDKAWMSNGMLWSSWDGITTFRTAGMYQAGGWSQQNNFTVLPSYGGITNWLVAGVPASNASGPSFAAVNLFLAYSLTRNDGYECPLNLYATAKDIFTHVPAFNGGTYTASFITQAIPYTNGIDILAQGTGGVVMGGFQIPNTEVPLPPGQGFGGMTNPPSLQLNFGGFSSINIYLGLYSINTYGQVGANTDIAFGAAGSTGYLLTNTPISNSFFLFTSIPATQQFFTLTTAQLPSWSGFIFSNPRGPSGMLFDWFTTNTPKYLENFNNSLVAAGFSLAPSTVWFSNLGTPEFFDPQNSDEVRTNDGDRITATKAFNDQLIVCKRNSFHKYLGSMTGNDISTLDLVDISLDYGCLSNKTIVAVKQKLFWLDKKGILYYDGAFKIA